MIRGLLVDCLPYVMRFAAADSKKLSALVFHIAQ